MRYTTVIDISENALLYRNINARLVYLHLALKAGYHDDDRDLCALSIRRLADEVGISISATRHALGVLQRAALIEREGNLWKVQKYLLQQPITARPRSERKRKEQEIRAIMEEEQREREAREEAEKKRLKEERRKTGKTGLDRMLEDLQKRADAGDIEAAQRLQWWKHNIKKK